MTVNINVPDRSGTGIGWMMAAIIACAALIAFFYFASPQPAQKAVENNATIEQPAHEQPPDSGTPQDEAAQPAAPSGGQEGATTAPAD